MGFLSSAFKTSKMEKKIAKHCGNTKMKI